MTLHTTKTICGIPIRNVKIALKRANIIDTSSLQSILKCNEQQAILLIEEAKIRGWCAPSRSKSYFQLTPAGVRFSHSKSRGPMPRARANEIIELIKSRAISFIDSLPNWPYYPSTIGVFGSYLSDTPAIENLEIAIELKTTPVDKPSMTFDEAIDLALSRGYKAHSNSELRVLPASFIYRQLIKRNNLISFYPWEVMKTFDCPVEIVWSRDSHSSE